VTGREDVGYAPSLCRPTTARVSAWAYRGRTFDTHMTVLENALRETA
jgi:hypothetical protein